MVQPKYTIYHAFFLLLNQTDTDLRWHTTYKNPCIAASLWYDCNYHT